MSITSIVLAGGQGSRMNHRDKAWAEHHGKALILHVIDSIKDGVDSIVISRNRSHPGYDALPYECVSDLYENYQGPLAGIASCTPHIKTDLTLVVPCDTPNLPADLVSRLLEQINDHELVVARDETNLQPLIFLAKTSTLTSIPTYLATGKRSVTGWLETLDYTGASFVDYPSAFENINKIKQLR